MAPAVAERDGLELVGYGFARADYLARIARQLSDNRPLAPEIAAAIAAGGWSSKHPAEVLIDPRRAPRGIDGAHRLAWMVAEGLGAELVPVAWWASLRH